MNLQMIWFENFNKYILCLEVDFANVVLFYVELMSQHKFINVHVKLLIIPKV